MDKRLRELFKQVTPTVEFYLKREIDAPANHQEFAREAQEKLDKWHELEALLAAPSEPQASEPPCKKCGWPIVPEGEAGCWESNCSMRPMPQPESVSNEPMMTVAQRNYQAAYIAATMANQPESVSAQGNKQVFM